MKHIQPGGFKMKKFVHFLITVLMATSPLNIAEATTVTAGSGFFAVRNDSDSGSATWRFSNPTAADTISWTSGINRTDGAAHAINTFGPEPKFTTVPALAGRVFAGFADNDGPGPLLSTTSTSGSGNSAIVPGTLWGTNAVANWTITATGTRGVAGGGGMGFPRWDSTATAKDPYNIFQSQLDDIGVTTSQFDLFFAIGLAAGNLTSLGEIGLNASYENMSGMTDIIDIAIDANGATVTGNNAATFYLLSSLDEGPTEISANMTSLTDIETLLTNDIFDLSIDTSVYLGIVIEDILVPTNTLSNGAFSQIHINSIVRDADAAVPEPDTMLLLGSGLAVLAGSKLRRKKR